MLEPRALLLRPAAAGQPRVISDIVNKEPLGFASWQCNRKSGWWNRWRAPVLYVHEQEEAPLVFTVRRRGILWPRHEVRDAEGERVGSIRERFVRDRNNVIYARARFSGSETVYENRLGAVLAITRQTPAGLEVTFEKILEGNPFAKMLLLAAALLQE
jgi:hypothetical protein